MEAWIQQVRSKIDIPIKRWLQNARPVGRVLFWGAVILIALGAALYIYRYPILRGTASLLVYDSEPEACDVIVVLGGGETLRIERGIELYRQGYAHRFLITLPQETEEGAAYRDILNLESLQCRAVLQHHGVPPDVVEWSPVPYYSTYDEVRFIKRWLDERGWTSALVVPGLFQSRRAKRVLDHFFDPHVYRLRVIPARGRFVSAGEWWTHEEGIIEVENELLKSLYYQCRLMWPD